MCLDQGCQFILPEPVYSYYSLRPLRFARSATNDAYMCLACLLSDDLPDELACLCVMFQQGFKCSGLGRLMQLTSPYGCGEMDEAARLGGGSESCPLLVGPDADSTCEGGGL
jgi:hypothetical protein